MEEGGTLKAVRDGAPAAVASLVTVQSPGHISGYFRPVTGTGYHDTGSTGAGVVTEEGVRVRASPSGRTEISARRIDSNGGVREAFRDSPPLSYVAGRLGVAARIETECMLPIGAGFGLSASALLATVAALNILFDLGMTRIECAALAHEAEIVHRTGLGDVAACQGGGRDYRLGPGVGAEILRFHDLDQPLYAVNFGPLHSPDILGSEDALDRVTSAYPSGYPGSPGEFFRLSLSFAEQSGLLTPNLLEILARCGREGIPASMTMLGNGIFAMGEGAPDLLASYGEVLSLHVALGGVRVLEVVP